MQNEKCKRNAKCVTFARCLFFFAVTIDWARSCTTGCIRPASPPSFSSATSCFRRSDESKIAIRAVPSSRCSACGRNRRGFPPHILLRNSAPPTFPSESTATAIWRPNRVRRQGIHRLSDANRKIQQPFRQVASAARSSDVSRALAFHFAFCILHFSFCIPSSVQRFRAADDLQQLAGDLPLPGAVVGHRQVAKSCCRRSRWRPSWPPSARSARSPPRRGNT